MVNRSRTTPISANTSTWETSCTKSRPYGPTIAPATKNPTTAGSPSLSKKYTTTIETLNRTTRSRRKAISDIADSRMLCTIYTQPQYTQETRDRTQRERRHERRLWLVLVVRGTILWVGAHRRKARVDFPREGEKST